MPFIPPFGSPPTPKATSTRYGTVTLAMLSSPTPTSMQADFTIAAHTQVSAPATITVGVGQSIIIGNDAVLVIGK